MTFDANQQQTGILSNNLALVSWDTHLPVVLTSHPLRKFNHATTNVSKHYIKFTDFSIIHYTIFVKENRMALKQNDERFI